MLGKQPKRVDPRTLQLARYLTPELPPPPAAVDNGGSVKQTGGCSATTRRATAPGRRRGTPTCCGRRPAQRKQLRDHHQRRCCTPTRRRPVTTLRPDRPARTRPTEEPTCSMPCLLGATTAWTVRGSRPTSRWTPRTHDHVKSAIDLFGCAYVGVQLPDAVLPTEHGVPQWTVPPDGSAARKPEPGQRSLLIYSAYDAHGPTVVTWGLTVNGQLGLPRGVLRRRCTSRCLISGSAAARIRGG